MNWIYTSSIRWQFVLSKDRPLVKEIFLKSFDRFIRLVTISFLHFLFFKLQVCISQTTDFHLGNYRFSCRKFQILSSFHKLQTSISFLFANWVPVTNQRDKVQRLNDDIKTTEARLRGDTERELWDVRKVVRQSNQNFWCWKFSFTCLLCLL